VPSVQEIEQPSVITLWRAAREANARAMGGDEAVLSARASVVPPIPVSIQVLGVPQPEPAPQAVLVPSKADVMPPAVVLGLQVAVGLVVGANPLVLAAGAAAIVVVAYLVRRTIATESSALVRRTAGRPVATTQAVDAATFPAPVRSPISPQASAPGSSPTAAPTSPPSAAPIPIKTEAPPPPAQPTSDLRWLWGTILRDPTARPPRRDRD
jgi:hypothetical protein